MVQAPCGIPVPPQHPILCGKSMRQTSPEPLWILALAGPAVPRHFAPLEGFLYSLKDAHIFIETQELFWRRRFPSWAPTSVYRKDSMQIFLN